MELGHGTLEGFVFAVVGKSTGTKLPRVHARLSSKHTVDQLLITHFQ